MNEITPFNFGNTHIRVVTDEHGEPLFVGKDVCDALGYSDATTAIRSHCKGVQILHPLQTDGGLQKVRVLTEPDMMRLVVNSTLPAAEAFERLVFDEILPTIRKTGSYSAPGRTPRMQPNDAARVKAWLLIGKAVAGVKGVKPEMAMAVTLDAIERDTGMPATAMRLALPGAKAEEVEKLTATQIGARLVPARGAKAVNLALEQLGLQVKGGRDGWTLTDAGMAHGQMIPFTRHGHSGYQAVWHESAISVLASHFASTSNVVPLTGAAS